MSVSEVSESLDSAFIIRACSLILEWYPRVVTISLIFETSNAVFLGTILDLVFFRRDHLLLCMRDYPFPRTLVCRYISPLESACRDGWKTYRIRYLMNDGMNQEL